MSQRRICAHISSTDAQPRDKTVSKEGILGSYPPLDVVYLTYPTTAHVCNYWEVA